ncbi:methionyl-tRNA formyltransferase [Cutibacterium sp. WCA-380-WT-3A]|uniref:Methionyl-tRNA formyltransferase n=1 Tax=Cutibacterium porci TaxID=2605781 RepID=A0A7K0J682_9ACTN|nr:methionyl-tRNA formyltransferase [Cutibacterium porci]MSS45466.1 methionyl-tRNA formyltransferase [Cutibacterium porci]
MRLLFAGTPDVAVPTLTALAADRRHEVVVVLTRPDAAVGRHRTPRPCPVAMKAEELGIPTMKAATVKSGDVHDAVASLNVDAAVVVAYGGLIPADLLTVPRHGWINLHFSLLPRWRGAAPVQRAIMAGDAETGACVFQLVEALDAGPIYRTMTVPIGSTTTAGELLQELAQTATPLVISTLEDLDAGVAPTPQSTEGVTIASQIHPDDVRVTVTADAEDIDHLVRGASPSPGAWAQLDDKRFKILRTRRLEADDDVPSVVATAQPGQLVATRKQLFLGTGSQPLELLSVQAFGKRTMNGADWARGANINAGTRLR